MKLNGKTGVSYDFIGPPEAETTDRKVKFPIGVSLTSLNAATINLVPTYAKTVVKQAVAGTMTINADVAGAHIGDEMYVELANDGTARTVTFGTGFIAASTVVGTINKTIVVSFYFNGTVFQERARTAAF